MDSKEYWEKDRRPKPQKQDDETYGEFCHALREARKERRAHAYDVHHEELKRLGLQYETKNAGHHVIIYLGQEGLADFWPASGKWFARLHRQYGMGLHRLMRKYGVVAAKQDTVCRNADTQGEHACADADEHTIRTACCCWNFDHPPCPVHPNPNFYRICSCGHPWFAHIYGEGACRPGFACPLRCEKFELNLQPKGTP